MGLASGAQHGCSLGAFAHPLVSEAELAETFSVALANVPVRDGKDLGLSSFS